MNFLALFIIVTTALIVFFDTRKVGIKSSFKWFFATLLLWPIAFPLYAWKRKKTGDRFSIFAIFICIVMLGLVIFPALSSRSNLVSCQDAIPIATDSAKGLLDYYQQTHESITIENVHEQGFDPTGNRLCKGTLKADLLTREIQFDIQREDPAEGSFSVGITIEGFPNP